MEHINTTKRARTLDLTPVCAPAETVEELRYQIEILLESYEKFSLKKQIEETYDGKSAETTP